MQNYVAGQEIAVWMFDSPKKDRLRAMCCSVFCDLLAEGVSYSLLSRPVIILTGGIDRQPCLC